MSHNLVDLRKKLGMSQKDFAASLGLAQTTYNGYETGSRKPRSDFWIKVAEKYNVTVDYLMGYSDNATSPAKQKSAPSVSDEALEIAKQFDAASPSIQNVIRAALAAAMEEAKARPKKPAFTILDTPKPRKPTKVVQLYGARYAAGSPETPGDISSEDYETEDLRAEFAIHVNGNSMEPYLHDGSVALCVKRMPEDGEVGAFYLDGGFLVKQVCQDSQGTIYLFSLNRDRRDADEVIKPDSGRELLAMGTVLMEKKIPLPED